MGIADRAHRKRYTVKDKQLCKAFGAILHSLVVAKPNSVWQRPGPPLPVAQLDQEDGGCRAHTIDVEEGLLAGQLSLRGLLRQGEKRNVLRQVVGRGLNR